MRAKFCAFGGGGYDCQRTLVLQIAALTLAIAQLRPSKSQTLCRSVTLVFPDKGHWNLYQQCAVLSVLGGGTVHSMELGMAGRKFNQHMRVSCMFGFEAMAAAPQTQRCQCVHPDIIKGHTHTFAGQH